MSISVPESVENESVAVQGLFPDPSWWNNDISERREDRVSEIMSKISDADAVGIVDTDADGLACEAVLRDKYNSPVVIQANGGANGISLSHALNVVSSNLERDIPVVVADLSPDSTFSAFQASLATVDAPIHLFDHHDWKWTALQSIETVVEEIVVEDGKCAAQILQENHHEEANETLQEFLEVTADHDLWKKEDPRSDHLSTLAFELPREHYISSALEYGADMLRESDRLRSIYDESERKSEERAKIAVENAEWFGISGADVAVTYFDCHQSRVGDELLENGADLAVIIQPTLSLSLRSTEDFGRCAELARGIGGGGHPTAAGGRIYDRINVPDNYDEDFHLGSSIERNLSEPSKFEYVWYNGGTPAVECIAEYLESSL